MYRPHPPHSPQGKASLGVEVRGGVGGGGGGSGGKRGESVGERKSYEYFTGPFTRYKGSVVWALRDT